MRVAGIRLITRLIFVPPVACYHSHYISVVYTRGSGTSLKWDINKHVDRPSTSFSSAVECFGSGTVTKDLNFLFASMEVIGSKCSSRLWVRTKIQTITTLIHGGTWGIELDLLILASYRIMHFDGIQWLCGDFKHFTDFHAVLSLRIFSLSSEVLGK